MPHTVVGSGGDGGSDDDDDDTVTTNAGFDVRVSDDDDDDGGGGSSGGGTVTTNAGFDVRAPGGTGGTGPGGGGGGPSDGGGGASVDDPASAVEARREERFRQRNAQEQEVADPAGAVEARREERFRQRNAQEQEATEPDDDDSGVIEGGFEGSLPGPGSSPTDSALPGSTTPATPGSDVRETREETTADTRTVTTNAGFDVRVPAEDDESGPLTRGGTRREADRSRLLLARGDVQAARRAASPSSVAEAQGRTTERDSVPQSTGVRVTVVAESGGPVSDAGVIVASSSGVVRRATTDQSGVIDVTFPHNGRRLAFQAQSRGRVARSGPVSPGGSASMTLTVPTNAAGTPRGEPDESGQGTSRGGGEAPGDGGPPAERDTGGGGAPRGRGGGTGTVPRLGGPRGAGGRFSPPSQRRQEEQQPPAISGPVDAFSRAAAGVLSGRPVQALAVLALYASQNPLQAAAVGTGVSVGTITLTNYLGWTDIALPFVG